MSQPGRLDPRGAVAVILATAAAGLSCAGTAAPPAREARPSDRFLAPQPRNGNPACPRPEMFGPVQVMPDVYRARLGAGAQRFSELSTTKARPLEECGLKPMLRRLMELRCDDRSNPFGGDLHVAHASRAGNFGPGGRCESIIDRYDVKCPEATYQVYADMYFCPTGG